MLNNTIRLDEVNSNYVAVNKIRTNIISDGQAIWAFLLLFSIILLWSTISKNLSNPLLYGTIFFNFYIVYILFSFKSCFVVDPETKTILYSHKAGFLGEKIVEVASFDKIAAIIVNSENNAYRNYLTIAYYSFPCNFPGGKTLSFLLNEKTQGHLQIKNIHNEDSIEKVNLCATNLAQVIGCECHLFSGQTLFLGSNYKLNSFDRQWGYYTAALLITIFFTLFFLIRFLFK